MSAENITIDFHFGGQVHNIGNLDVFHPVKERLKTLNVFFILRIHHRQQQGIDVFLDVFHFMNAFADDVVQLN